MTNNGRKSLPVHTTLDDLALDEREQLAVFAERAVAELARGNRLAAHRLLDEADRMLANVRRYEEKLLNTPLSETELSVRTLNLLEQSFRATTIGDALEVRQDELVATPSCGWLTTVTIYGALLRYVVPRLIRAEEELERRG